MTVSTTISRQSYATNGASTSFGFSEPYFAPTDLVVTLVVTATGVPVAPAPVLNGNGPNDYVVNGSPSVPPGRFEFGTIVFNTAPAGGSTLTIQRIVPATQETSLNDNTLFPAKAVEYGLDRATMIAQQQIDATNNVISVPPGDPQIGRLTLPFGGARANNTLTFGPDGQIILVPFQYPTAGGGISMIYASAFGAVGDGVTDDTAALQSAINAAAVLSPAIVLLNARSYVITQSLIIGNGGAGVESTVSEVYLRGVPCGWIPAQILPPVTNPAGTRLIWGGPPGLTGAMVVLNGPLRGWGITDVIFDADPGGTFGAYVGIGLHIISASFGVCQGLTLRGCKVSIYSETVLIAGLNTDSYYNRFTDTKIAVGWTAGAVGIVLTGLAGPNTDFNRFTNTIIALPTVLGAGQSAYGVVFQSCDSNSFEGLQFLNGASPYAFAVVFDYTINPSWPSGNQIEAVDWGGLNPPVLNSGTPAPNTSGNYIRGISEANFGITPVEIPNLVVQYGIIYTHFAGPLTGAQAQTVLCTPNRTGLYRYTFYLEVTAGSSSAVLNVGAQWFDQGGVRGGFIASCTATAASFCSGSSVFMAVANNPVSWTVTLSAAAPGLSYSVSMVLERLI